jgi:hypothetical protein
VLTEGIPLMPPAQSRATMAMAPSVPERTLDISRDQRLILNDKDGRIRHGACNESLPLAQTS